MTTECWPLMGTWVQVNFSEAVQFKPVSSAKSIKMTPIWCLSFHLSLRSPAIWLLSPVRRGQSAPQFDGKHRLRKLPGSGRYWPSHSGPDLRRAGYLRRRRWKGRNAPKYPSRSVRPNVHRPVYGGQTRSRVKLTTYRPVRRCPSLVSRASFAFSLSGLLPHPTEV